MTDSAKDIEGRDLPNGSRVNIPGEVVESIGDSIVLIRPPGARRDDLAWSFFAIPSKLVSKLPDEMQPVNEGPTLPITLP